MSSAVAMQCRLAPPRTPVADAPGYPFGNPFGLRQILGRHQLAQVSLFDVRDLRGDEPPGSRTIRRPLVPVIGRIGIALVIAGTRGA
jgi:hypothetical protein